jgi:hypothetical protein
MGPPDRPDAWDADLSAVHDAVDNLSVWLAIWERRAEPDAYARRCASDAVGAIDAALAGLHSIRGRLISQTRRADDATAARVDALLARTRDGPPGEREGGPVATPSRHPATPTPPPPQQRGSDPWSVPRGRGGGGGR